MIQPIPSLPTYYATKDGRIFKYRIKTDDLYQLSDNTRSNSGYKMVQPYKDGVRKLKYVHQLVLEAFYGPRPEGMQCDHINRNKLDNDIDNLRYITHQQNMMNRDMSNVGSKKGQKYKQYMTPKYKKYGAQVAELRKNGHKPAVIAEIMNITPKAVYHASRYLQLK